MIAWWSVGAVYVAVAALVAVYAWSPDPDERPGGGPLACVVIGALWPLRVVGVVIAGIAWLLGRLGGH